MNGNKKKINIDKDIIISSFDKNDLNDFIQIHIESLFSDSEFSKIYLTERFKYLIGSEYVVTVSAKGTNGKMLGLVYGGPEGFKRQMNKYIMRRIACNLLKKPYFLFGNEFLYKYKSGIKKMISKISLRKKNNVTLFKNVKHQYKPPEPVLRLTGIAVLEEFSHLGIGEQLLIGYEKAAKERKYRSIILETPETNERAVKFYEKFGWKTYINENANLGKVYFYKLILEND